MKLLNVAGGVAGIYERTVGQLIAGQAASSANAYVTVIDISGGAGVLETLWNSSTAGGDMEFKITVDGGSPFVLYMKYGGAGMTSKDAISPSLNHLMGPVLFDNSLKVEMRFSQAGYYCTYAARVFA